MGFMGVIKNRWIKGSFSVEVTVIVGVILLLLMEFVFLTFLFHDKCLLESAAYEAISEGVVEVKQGEDLEEERIQRLFYERVDGKLILLQGATATIEKKKGEVILRGQANFRKIPIRYKEQMQILWQEKKLRRIREIQKKGEEWKEESQ